jgi:hypothetical protein
MWRSASDLWPSLALLAAACGTSGGAPTVALCGRGDREALAEQVASLELTFVDDSGAALGDPIDLDPDDGHVGSEIPAGAARARVVGYDAGGAPVASGQGTVDGDGGCACVALDAQARAACEGVSCRLVDDACRFLDAAGDPVAAQTLRFGEGPDDDIGGVTSDTFIQEDEPDATHDGTTLEAGPTPVRIGLVRFDLAALPASAVVESARLLVTVCDADTCGSSHTFSIRALLEAWTEAATWNQRVPGSAWNDAGCGPASCDAAPLGTLASPSIAGATEVVELDTSAVGSWVADPAGNHGLALVPEGDTGTAVHLDASESSGAARPPALEITYTLP